MIKHMLSWLSYWKTTRSYFRNLMHIKFILKKRHYLRKELESVSEAWKHCTERIFVQCNALINDFCCVYTSATPSPKAALTSWKDSGFVSNQLFFVLTIVVRV